MVYVVTLVVLLLILAALWEPWFGRAKLIATTKGALPSSETLRDAAYVVAYYDLFGEREFGLHSIEGKKLPKAVMKRFGVKSGRLDDRVVLGSRLIGLQLVESRSLGRYRLTDKGATLALSYRERTETT